MNLTALLIVGMVMTVPIVAIVMDGVKGIYKARAKELMHQENIERLRHGYPPIEDKSKNKSKNKIKNDEIIDTTRENYQHSN